MEGFWLDSVSPNGLHRRIVEGDDRTVWMYLHDLQTREVILGSPVCSLVPPVSLFEFQKSYKRGDIPPLVGDFSTDQAVVTDLSGLVLRWAEDQISVVAILNGEPRTMILAQEKKGYSRAVRVETGPWGCPWDETKYRDNFEMPS
jgi:hypothetical protein